VILMTVDAGGNITVIPRDLPPPIRAEKTS
jgi:hypothetical protein